MEIINYLNNLNETEDQINEINANYGKVMDKLDATIKQVKDELPSNIVIVPIDQKMLMQRALNGPTVKIRLLGFRYKHKILTLDQLCHDIDSEMYSESQTQLLIHENVNTQNEIGDLGKQLFRAVFGSENIRYHLLDKNTIGENILYPHG